MTLDSNPLLNYGEYPRYSKILPEHVDPAITHVLDSNRKILAGLRHNIVAKDWADFATPLDIMSDAIDRVWGPVSHLNSVSSSPELRVAYESALAKLSDYGTALGQNKNLYRGFQSLLNSPDYPSLDVAQREVIDQALRNFKHSGVHLPAQEQKRYRDLSLRLSELNSQFANNVLDATQAWSRLISDEALLAGIPESAKGYMAGCAHSRGLEGWLVTLQPTCVQAVLTYADDRALREEVYFNNTTRASELGPNAGEYDNGPIITEILAVRSELSHLLGYQNYAEYSLSSKMAESVPQVLEFLYDLAQRCKSGAQGELIQLKAYAAARGVSELQSWDLAYFAELQLEDTLQVSQEALRPYFPASHVLTQMFELAQRLFSVQFKEMEGVDVWHPDVRFFEVVEEEQGIGHFYLDLYARPEKRAGAWMDGCVSRRRAEKGRLQLPMAQLVCNFTPAADGAPALLTHDEVVTLFHEFGHGLHHLLTQVEQPSVAGVNGVAWDAVELPSQFMENWCWQREILNSLSRHVVTEESLPQDVIECLLKSRDYNTALETLRQIEMALFDFELHASTVPLNYIELMGDVRSRISMLPPPAFNRFANSFSHVFAGGYAAGYYSYKWAEVLAADAFARFKEEGLFNTEVGSDFRNSVLAWGGAVPAMELFLRFRGRVAKIDALLEQAGLVS